ncbi:MAG: tetratricopeptide repeat protein, partial [Ktedonobacteraceae bacterium]|nr:tetratricopeptide repeat protein [Ktedonobacteraceae bacterium]
QALMHAYEAREYNLAARIIIEGARSIIYEEHSEMILHWLEQLPQEIFNQYPQLLLIASNIHLRHGEFALVPPLLDTADSLLPLSAEALDQRTNESLQAELAIARGHLFFFQGEFKRTQELCQQALALLSPNERLLRIRAYQYLGVSLIVGQGQIQEGITQLQSALQMSRSERNERQAATLHRLVANAYSWIANHVLAEYHQMRALQIWEKLNNTQGIIYGQISMGLLKMRQGLVQEAEELLRRALQLSGETPPFKSGEAYALVGLGDLYNNLGKYVEALNYLEDSLNLARTCDDHYLVNCSLCSLALTYLFLGDAPTAQFFLNQVVLKEGERQSFEGCLFLLMQGTVYLAQQQYEQAEKTLIQASDTCRRSSIQIMYISALQRLAVCYLRQNKKQAAYRPGQQIIDLNKKGDFDFLIQVEVRRYHELAAFLEQVPEMASPAEEAPPIEEAPPVEEAPPEVLVVPQRHDHVEGVLDRQSEQFFQVLALGEPQVIPHGVPVTRWRMARSMELFFFLLEKRKPVRKEQITMALWTEHDSEQTDSTVRTMIYYLRRALGKNMIVSQSGLYSLDSTELGKGTFWYDVDVFNDQHRQAKKALEAEDDDTARIALTKMVNLYSGDYVQPFYNDWCIPRRDKLRQAYMDAHHQLARIAWRGEDWEDSLLHWQRLVALDVCYEAAHYGIMRCYLQQGKRELALRQFQSCNQILQEELSTTPKAALQKLYHSILKQA